MTTRELDVVAAYAEQLGQADQVADVGSIAAARAVETLYQRGDWVAEWNEVRPIKTGNWRPADPRGRNRFSHWLAWKLQQDGHRPIATGRTYQLLEAKGVLDLLSHCERSLNSEGAIRPLVWLTKHNYAARVPDVWTRAVELAGGVGDVTSAHTRRAVTEWKRDTLGRRGVREAIRTRKAERDRIRAQAQVQVLWSDGDDDEVRRFDAWYREFRREKAEATRLRGIKGGAA